MGHGNRMRCFVAAPVPKAIVRRLQREIGAAGAEIGGALDLVAEQVKLLDVEQDYTKAASVHKTISEGWRSRPLCSSASTG